jgi:hypothetical protein
VRIREKTLRRQDGEAAQPRNIAGENKEVSSRNQAQILDSAIMPASNWNGKSHLQFAPNKLERLPLSVIVARVRPRCENDRIKVGRRIAIRAFSKE